MKSTIPVDPFDIALYLIYISESCKSLAPIVKVVAAISRAHKLTSLSDQTTLSIVSGTAEETKRALAKPIIKECHQKFSNRW